MLQNIFTYLDRQFDPLNFLFYIAFSQFYIFIVFLFYIATAEMKVNTFFIPYTESESFLVIQEGASRLLEII